MTPVVWTLLRAALCGTKRDRLLGQLQLLAVEGQNCQNERHWNLAFELVLVFCISDKVLLDGGIWFLPLL